MSRYIPRLPRTHAIPYKPVGKPDPLRPEAPVVVEKGPTDAALAPEAFVNGRLPLWNEPGYYSKPLDRESAWGSMAFYETLYPIFQMQLSPGLLGVVTGISYEVTCSTQYDVFNFYVSVNGDLLATWEDCLINPAAANPANRWAFGGHVLPIPFFGLVDNSGTLVVSVVAHGVEPFTKTKADVYGCNARVALTGYQTEKGTTDPIPTDDNVGELHAFPWRTPVNNADFDTLRNLPPEIRRAWGR